MEEYNNLKLVTYTFAAQYYTCKSIQFMNIRILTSLIVLQLLISYTPLAAQQEDASHIPNFVAFGIQYGVDLPAGDLADRFGQSYHVTTSLDIYNSRWNGMFGLEGSIQFGNKVKEDVLANIRSATGAILGFNNQPADVFLRRRGFYIGLYANKTFIKSRKNPSSGLNLGIGAGLLQHNIRLQDDTASATQLRGDYSKGYDRLTRGPALKQSLTYLHVGQSRSVNYTIGLSIIEGFTESVRNINFDTQESAAGGRTDIMISLEGKWFIPLKNTGQRNKETFY